MGLGSFIYKFYFKPTLKFRYNLTHFGIKGWYQMTTGEASMKREALKLRNYLSNYSKDNIQLNFLTGKNYWHQTIFCIESFIQHYGNNFSVNIYSDGTINDKIKSLFKNYCKEIEIVSNEKIETKLKRIIPIKDFPYLNQVRAWHPFFRRLIDIHINPGWNLHLDSDMLFFKYPSALIEAFERKQAIFMFEQLDDSYFVDSVVVLKEKFDIDTIEKVNGGIIAYNSDQVNYIDLEEKLRVILQNYKTAIPAEVEQTLMSHILFNQYAKPLSKDEYNIFYGKDINSGLKTVSHYIFKAKKPYFSQEWKRVIKNL